MIISEQIAFSYLLSAHLQWKFSSSRVLCTPGLRDSLQLSSVITSDGVLRAFPISHFAVSFCVSLCLCLIRLFVSLYVVQKSRRTAASRETEDSEFSQLTILPMTETGTWPQAESSNSRRISPTPSVVQGLSSIPHLCGASGLCSVPFPTHPSP